VISGRTNTVVATVPVGREPEGVAVNPRTSTAYVANTLDNTVSALRKLPRTSSRLGAKDPLHAR
jgi:DNA-binding beta-propeller fold protein YncE